MIEINLLPAQAKVKVKKSSINPARFIPLFIGVGILLACVHVLLIIISGIKFYQLRDRNAKWENLLPQRRQLEQLKAENESGNAQTMSVQQLMRGQVNFARKINKLSLSLPSGIWFTELSLNLRELTLRASVVSLEKQELNLINKLIEGLKSDQDFIGDFESLELGSVQRRMLAGYEIVDFVLNGKIKAK